MEKRKKKKSHLEPLSAAAQAQDTESLHLKGSNMGFYHKWLLTLVARIASAGCGDLWFDPPRMQIFCHPCHIRSDQRVGPVC
jgi:hypothetical protein